MPYQKRRQPKRAGGRNSPSNVIRSLKDACGSRSDERKRNSTYIVVRHCVSRLVAQVGSWNEGAKVC